MKTKEVKLDFSDVEFVSRSAVHEFLSLRNQLQKKSWKKKNIEFTNTNESVKEMFRTVAANIAIPKNKRLLEKIEKIDIQTLIKKTSNS
ncbi:MAG: hypothetical protein A3F54_04145 [Candidatus Kerfeldbacteria bacterium RIFCSPHIGHO2_12_FULL_48_17]|uniref:STAS domain-containing protein n=1 Tax=Candidatus Kerfeldbacteria bacterium RIFCSPHIGHO2_12_FULL_48_17 TaxID=1798542 RepID=A0A1G2B6S0_9BACT|nr:MAG: hypothetical protein A3F54_04145 [Candidatus Kerfeldbacteria bacterium RIFCSPHIGHO2_12_FULL_48_17]